MEHGETVKGVPRPEMVLHSEWESEAPVGFHADAARRNLAPGESFEFKGIKIQLEEMIALSLEDKKAMDKVCLLIESDEAVVTATQEEGSAFQSCGLRVAVVAVHARKDELGTGLTEIEVATLESLPAKIKESNIAGGATMRARIPHDIKMITLHHSGSAKAVTDEAIVPQKLRDLQTWGKRDKNWWDIPYHFVIGPSGNIYEGRDVRYMGETNTKYNPSGHFLISAIGNYNIQDANPDVLNAIADLMAWAVSEYEVPLDKIYGHCDLAETSCPGNNLRPYLKDGTFRKMVEERLAASDK